MNDSNKKQSPLFLHGKEQPEEQVDEGIRRQVLGYAPTLMMVRVCFNQGAEGYVHAHPHTQVTYVESGVFDFRIGTETQRLKRGDCAFIPPDVDHGAICIEAGELLDVFSPMREDFLS